MDIRIVLCGYIWSLISHQLLQKRVFSNPTYFGLFKNWRVFAKKLHIFYFYASFLRAVYAAASNLEKVQDGSGLVKKSFI
jgi:hypothetical protein